MKPDAKKSLLSIIEAGGYPNFTVLYEQAGFTVTSTNTMRRALVISKRLKPDCVVAEFHFGPTYGTRISNLESLFAGLQRDNPQARLIVFIDWQDIPHLRKILPIFPVYATLHYPVERAQMADTIRRVAAEMDGDD